MLNLLASVAAGRWDLYGLVHKGLRLGHVDLMTRLGQADFDGDQTQLLAQLRGHLVLAASHLQHEEQFIHTALEARAPGACRTLEAQHRHHHDRFATLEAAIVGLEQAEPAARRGRGRALYLDFTAFVAEDLEHMRQEETETWPLLCERFTDEELAGVEMQIIGSLSPEENIGFMRMMLPAISRPERSALLAGMKSGAPPEAYAAVIDLAARPTLAAADLADLERLGLAA